mmetsp:Transcript_20206/g.35989  ORF Transcript_20206/g.35989 Transcript_20206/m.35989 type:complete len:83 (+) Transcript_20206:356-604(+)
MCATLNATTEIEDFNGKVTSLLTVLRAQSLKIESAKLLAIGQKNRNKNEVENRRRMATELKLQISLKKQELERYVRSIEKKS